MTEIFRLADQFGPLKLVRVHPSFVGLEVAVGPGTS
jgi:hypothetical protein